MDDEDSRFDENGWLRPDTTNSYFLAMRWYRDHFRIGDDRNQHCASYVNHYRAATRRNPNRISVERMQWLADKIALERIRGNWK